MSGFPGAPVASARFGQAQAIARRGEPVHFQRWVRSLSRNPIGAPAVAERRAGVKGWRDGEEMPLICPTCQLAFEASPPAAGYFAWGCFRYFGVPLRKRDISSVTRIDDRDHADIDLEQIEVARHLAPSPSLARSPPKADGCIALGGAASQADAVAAPKICLYWCRGGPCVAGPYVLPELLSASEDVGFLHAGVVVWAVW